MIGRHMLGSIAGLILLAVPLQGFPADEAPASVWQIGEDGNLWMISKVKIEVDDQVSGGCLPQPGRLADKAEVILRQNGFSIESPGKISPVLQIRAVGYEANPGACAVWIKGNLMVYLVAKVPFTDHRGKDTNALVRHHVSVGGTLLTGRKEDMQDRLEALAKDFAEEVYLVVNRARDTIETKYPDIMEAVLHKYQQQRSN